MSKRISLAVQGLIQCTARLAKGCSDWGDEHQSLLRICSAWDVFPRKEDFSAYHPSAEMSSAFLWASWIADKIGFIHSELMAHFEDWSRLFTLKSTYLLY